MTKIRIVLLVLASFVVASGREFQALIAADEARIIAALPVVPPGLNDSHILEIKVSKSVSAVHTFRVNAPSVTATEWIIFTPRPPEFPGQRVLDAHTFPGSENTFEMSPLKQPVMRAMIVRNFEYEYLGEQDRKASHVRTFRKSDCGGLAVLFCTVLRAQGIPARSLAGRWAISAMPDEKIVEVEYHQEHVKAEFFAQGVGWVPVDLSSAILHDRSPGKLEHFGNDRGDFPTLHFDNDLALDTLFFGIRPMPLLQRPSYWVRGSGNVDNAVVRENWTVTRLDRN